MAAGAGLPLRPGVPQDRLLERIETAPPHPYVLQNIPARRVARIGLKPATMERLSTHGQRAGFITEAYKAGARDEVIMEHSHHKGMRGYVGRAEEKGEHGQPRLAERGERRPLPGRLPDQPARLLGGGGRVEEGRGGLDGHKAEDRKADPLYPSQT